MRRALIALVLVAALVLAGCAGPGGEGVNETNDTGMGNDTGLAGNDTGMDDNDTVGNDTADADVGSVAAPIAPT